MFKKKIELGILILAVFWVFLGSDCFGKEKVLLNDLIEDSIGMDQKKVVVTGEVIGEELERGEYSWININDGTNAIGIWVSKNQIKQIKYYGGYHAVGDRISIEGVFHRGCKIHGGDVDIHAEQLQVVKRGHTVVYPIAKEKIIAAIGISLLAVGVVYGYFVKKSTCNSLFRRKKIKGIKA